MESDVSPGAWGIPERSKVRNRSKAMSVISPIVIDNINDAMTTMMSNMQDSLAVALQNASSNPGSTAAMMELQYEMQRWSMGLNTQSNTVKALGDTLRSVISNLK